MKSKKNQIILLIAVVIIWGLVIYRFMALPSKNDDFIAPIPIRTTNLEVSKDSLYQYKLNYSDPFLNNSFHVPTRTSQKPKVIAKKSISTIKPKLPKIELVGLVTSNRSIVALLRLQSTTHIFKEGQEVNGFMVKKIGVKDVTLKYIPLDTIIVISNTSN